MGTGLSFENITDLLSSLPPEQTQNLEAEVMRHIRPHGVFGTSRVVEKELRSVAAGSQSRLEQVREVLIHDPLLALRVLSVANSTFYRRASAINDIAGALTVVGVKKLPELIEQVATSVSLAALFKGRAIASSAYEEALLGAIWARELMLLQPARKQFAEFTYLSAFLVGAVVASLAYYRPSLYAACWLNGLGEGAAGFESGLRKLMDRSKFELALEGVKALSLPDEFQIVYRVCEANPFKSRVPSVDGASKDTVGVAGAVIYGLKLAHALSSCGGRDAFDGTMKEAQGRLSIAKPSVRNLIGKFPAIYSQDCAALGWQPLGLPRYLLEYNEKAKPEELVRAPAGDQLDLFLTELRACFKTRLSSGEFFRLPQAALCTCMGLVRGVGFDRVVFLYHNQDRSCLIPLFNFGQPCLEFSYLLRSMSGTNTATMPDVLACQERRMVLRGHQIFSDGWPFIAFPVVWRDSVVGVFYADRITRGAGSPVETREQMACAALAEYWLEVPEGFG